MRALPPEELGAKIDDLCNGRRSFLRAAVRLLGCYPVARDLVPARTGEANAAVMGSLVLYRGHRFVHVQHRGGSVCLSCLRFFKEAGLKRQSLSECSAAYGTARSLCQTAVRWGHQPVVAFGFVDRAPIVMCRTCGCYTEATCVGRGERCTGRIPQSGPVYRRKHFLSGLHPRPDLTPQAGPR